MYKELSFDPDRYEFDEQEHENYFDEHNDDSHQDFEAHGYSVSDPDFSDLNFEDFSIDEPDILLDVPYVPSPDDVVETLLDLAHVSAKDTLYDLGCGDGRIVITAAQTRGTRGVGVDMDPTRIAEAMEHAGNVGVQHLVNFIEGDLLEINFRNASVVTLYLLDSINIELRPRLLNELRPGSRVVSHNFKMGDWKADKSVCCGNIHLHLWVIPAKVANEINWQTHQGDRLTAQLEQRYQQLTGQAFINGQPAELRSALLQGRLLELVVQTLDGKVQHRQLFECLDEGEYRLVGDG